MTRDRRELALEARVDGGPRTYRFRTADGVHSPDAFRPAELALLDSLWDADPGSLLDLQANYGVVGTVLAARADAVEMTETSARAARLCEANADTNGANVEVSVVADLTSLDATPDTVAYAPRPYAPVDVGRQRIADALDLLPSGGRLFLAARPHSGLARYRGTLADLADVVEEVGSRGDCEVLAATRSASVDAPDYLTPRHLTPTVGGIDLSLVSVPGVFAATGLDDGTRLLCESATIRDGQRVLDLCCGYGAAGVYAAASADCAATLTDDDRIATRCGACSLDASGVGGRVVTADCTRGVANEEFDLVLCNPPTHAGEGVLADLFAGLDDVLAARGEALVVHHRGVDLDCHLARFGSVETVAEGEEHVVQSLRR